MVVKEKVGDDSYTIWPSSSRNGRINKIVAKINRLTDHVDLLIYYCDNHQVDIKQDQTNDLVCTEQEYDHLYRQIKRLNSMIKNNVGNK